MRVLASLQLFKLAFLSILGAGLILGVANSLPATKQQNSPVTLHTVGHSFSMLPQSILDKCTKRPVILSVNYLGPKLMHSFVRDGLNLADVRRLNPAVLPGDTVIFFFGVIDCMAHVKPHSENSSVLKVIDDLVQGYEERIQQNAAFIPGTHICVAGVSPPFHAANIWADWGNHVKGTIAERLLYTNMMNEKLQKICARNNWTYVDFFDDYALEDGTLNNALSADGLHINVYSENTKIAIAKILDAY